MPATFEGHASLDQETWLWHRDHPGQLSRLAKEAIRREIALESLPDGMRDDALEAATAGFFSMYDLCGDYAVVGMELARHKATDAQMARDAEWLDVPSGRLMATLQELFDLELETQLKKRAILLATRKDHI